MSSTCLSRVFGDSYVILESDMKDDDEGFCQYYNLRAERLANLEEGEIRINICYTPDPAKITFKIIDSGNGFRQPEVSEFSDRSFYGRGLSLIMEIAESVTLNNIGNEVTAIYPLTSI